MHIVYIIEHIRTRRVANSIIEKAIFDVWFFDIRSECRDDIIERVDE